MIGGGAIPSIPLTPDNARLRVVNGPAAGTTFLLDRMRLVLGRNEPPVVVVDVDLTQCELGPTPMVSRRHAEVQWVAGELRVVDLASTNGTFVDGTRLDAEAPRQPSVPAVLRAGSRLRLGNVELEVVRDEN